MMQMLIANSQLALELKSVGYQDYFHTRSMQQIMRRPGARLWWARERKMYPSTTVAAVDEEAKQAVDYFGAVQMVGAAFLFGLGAARKLKR